MGHDDISQTHEAEMNAIEFTRFQAFNCDRRQENTGATQFSLNEPPHCNVTDGSVYFQPETRRAQILQYVNRIPVQVSVCQVKLEVFVGSCGGLGSSYNFMHASLETHRAYIQTTKAACHEAELNGKLRVTIPEYGSIRAVEIEIFLAGGIAEAAFQPIGYSRPNSYCKGNPFQPPANDQSRIKHLNNPSFEAKTVWGTSKISRAVVTYKLTVKVRKNTAFVTAKSNKLVIPHVITVDRTYPPANQKYHRSHISQEKWDQ